ncbi:MAG: hypothetical protein U0667_08810 [Chloroflexota bacterium]
MHLSNKLRGLALATTAAALLVAPATTLAHGSHHGQTWKADRIIRHQG